AVMLASSVAMPIPVQADVAKTELEFAERTYRLQTIDSGIVSSSKLLRSDSGLVLEYPDAVRGSHVTGHSAGGSLFDRLLKLIDSTDLNAMVIDIKDDFGNLTYKPEEDSPLFKLDIGKPYIKDPRKMLETLEEQKVYPIARVVVFKDSVL